MKKKMNIVVVDDEPHVANLIKLSLNSDKFNITEIYSPQKFFEHIKKEKVDLITMDIMMPSMDGLTIIREMQKDKDTKDIPVIIISAKNSMKDKISSINLGVMDYLEKPFDPSELNMKVKQALGL